MMYENDEIERLRKRIAQLGADDASELNGLLDGVCAHLAQKDEETERLSRAQAAAIVHSAAIIAELEETKERYEESQREVEAATGEAKMLSAFGDILEQSLNEIYIFDAETLRFVHVNHGARENLGYSMEELRELTPLDIKPEHTPESFAKLVAPLLDGSSDNLEFVTTHRRKDGSEYAVQVHLETSFLGNRKVFAAIILDITERQRFERQLQETREQALAADRMKSEFLANMSHEIRTPMTAILGFSELLLDANVSEHEKLSASQTIRRSGHHLLNLINDILDLSKVESGKLEIEVRVLNPASIIRDVKELLVDRASASGNALRVELIGEIPERIQTDPTRLKQAIVNLAGNAIKFTKNGVVRIVARCDVEQEQLRIQVIDSGIGMTPEQLSQIFQPFGQADSSTTRKFGGTGLGLTITRRISEQLGGDVCVVSEPGNGSTFTLTIATGPLDGVPMISTLERETTSRAKSAPIARSKNATRIDGRVLLVEDGPDNQRLISFILRKAGADVSLADNGKAGVEIASKALADGKPFGLILMDMQMPIMDGYVATATLREGSYSGQIVALTAHAMKGEIDRCLAAGCDAYLTKPIDRATFIEEVASRIGKPSPLAKDGIQPASRGDS